MKRFVTMLSMLFVAGAAFVGASSPAVAGTGEVIQVNAESWNEHYTDVGRKGESAGDTFDFTEKLFQHGDRVGRDAGHCVVKRVTKRSFTFQCTVTLHFKGKGDIIVQGAITFRRGSNENPLLAVTGGTGDYAGASGEFEITDQQRRDHYEIRLL
jgi:hypothetical protein